MKNLIILGVLLVSACTSTGVKVNHEQLATFQKGKTTYDEVVAKLGEPTQVMDSDYGLTAIYAYYSVQARPETFIPYIGAFVGGADMENTSVTMTFGNNRILRTLASSHGGMGMGNGFEANSQSRKSNQPN